METESFWDRVKGLLNQRKESWLANQLGINRSTVASWKTKGAIPKAELVLKVANLLDVSVDYLLMGEITQEDFYNSPVVIPKLIQMNIEQEVSMNDLYERESHAEFISPNLTLITNLELLKPEQLEVIKIQVKALADYNSKQSK